MFTQSAAYYDAIYAFKDYQKEVEWLQALIQEHARRPVASLLDLACGTGEHITTLREHYEVEGLDIDPDMLALAQQKHPDIVFHQADMADFDLGRCFDVVTCLFSSIGYVKTLPRLQQAVECMARHVYPGGLLIVEPWLVPDAFHEGSLHASFVDEPDLKVARISTSRIEDGAISVLDFHYLVGTPDGIEYFTEQHELGLFTDADYWNVLEATGTEVVYDPLGLTGRGLYIGKQPLEQD